MSSAILLLLNCSKQEWRSSISFSIPGSHCSNSKEEKPLTITTEQIGTPTNANDLANAILDVSAFRHLLSSFTSDDIMYVSGRLIYINAKRTITSSSESAYWSYDLFLRKKESSMQRWLWRMSI